LEIFDKIWEYLIKFGVFGIFYKKKVILRGRSVSKFIHNDPSDHFVVVAGSLEGCLDPNFVDVFLNSRLSKEPNGTGFIEF